MDVIDDTGQVRVSFDAGEFSGVAIGSAWQRSISSVDELGQVIATTYRTALRPGRTPTLVVEPSESVAADPKGTFWAAAERLRKAQERPPVAEVGEPSILEVAVPNCRAEHVDGLPVRFIFEPSWAENASAVQLSQAATRAGTEIWQAAVENGLELKEASDDH